jgi:AcrR family transcriptional regulator
MDHRAYHHGDLERALIAAGLQLMEETQDWAFSLRELARRAGVSHNAPYKHFADKQALLQAMAAQGFVALRNETAPAADAAGTAEDALLAIAVAYVRFGRRHPALYRLMFNAMCPTGGAPQSAAAQAALDVLRGVLRRFAWASGEAGAGAPELGALELAVLAAWSLVHGVTQLFVDGYVRQPGDEAADGLVAAMIRLQMRGLPPARGAAEGDR